MIEFLCMLLCQVWCHLASTSREYAGKTIWSQVVAHGVFQILIHVCTKWIGCSYFGTRKRVSSTLMWYLCIRADMF